MVQNMVHGKPLNLIIKFAIPLLIGNIFQQFYSMADTVIVGKTIGMNALAAVGATGALTFFIFGFFFGLTGGVTVITGQQFGAGDMAGTRRSIAASTMICGSITAVTTVICAFLAPLMLKWCNTPPDIFDEALKYVRIMFIGMAALVSYNLVSSIIRALGDSRTPLIFLVVSCILNIVLDLVFILCFRWGVAGAAAATVISQAIAGGGCYLHAKRRFPLLQLHKKDWQSDWQTIWAHLRLGLPSAFQFSVCSVGILIFQTVMNSLGVQAVAAYTTASKIDSVMIQPAFSFAIALGAFTAQNYGAKRYLRICKGAVSCGISSNIVAYIIVILGLIFSRQLVGLFVGAEQAELLLPQVRIVLWIQGCCTVFLTMLLVYRYALQGMGFALVPFLGGVLELIIRGCLSRPFCDWWGYPGVVLVSPLAWLGSFILLGIVYYRQIHRLCGRYF
jgi:putative MATE family efflux protein